MSVPGRVVPMQSAVPAFLAPAVTPPGRCNRCDHALLRPAAKVGPLIATCIGGRGHGARAACRFVPERNQHQGADGHCRIDDCREHPCSRGAVADVSHQIAQGQEAHRERAYADGRNSADRPAVNPAGRSRTDSEGDAVHGGEQCDGRDSGGTDLDDDPWQVRQHRVCDVADEADRGRADQQAPEEPDRPAVVPLRDPRSGSECSSPPAFRQFMCDGLPTYRHHQAGVHSECSQVRAQGRQEEVGLSLDPADLPLTRVQCGGQFDLRAPGGATDLG